MAPVSLSSSSLLSFTHSRLCIIDKSACVRGIFPRITFSPEIGGATFGLAQASRFPWLRSELTFPAGQSGGQICDICKFVFGLFFKPAAFM